MFLGLKASLNCTGPMQPNVLTSHGVLGAVCASGCSHDYIGLMEVQPSPGLLSCSAGSANAFEAPHCMFFVRMAALVITQESL